MSIQFCIVGGGSIGLAVAEAILLRFKNRASIRIIADKLYEQTTTYGCAGLLLPYQIPGNQDHSVNKWFAETLAFFHKLWYSESAGKAGVQLIKAYKLFEDTNEMTLPSWSNTVMNFVELSPLDLSKMLIPSKFRGGYSFDTIVVDQKYYMEYQTKYLIDSGVLFERYRLESHSDLERIIESKEYDVVINCCGIGAYELLSDSNVFPIRGQILRVRAPWIKSAYFFGSSYLIPNLDTIVVGGTAQKDNWDLSISNEDTKNIMDGVCELLPSLREAVVDNIWVGLRPGRTAVRLDSELKDIEGKTVVIAHCYGHGGSGVTLSVGCANDILDNHIIPKLSAI